MRPILDDGWFAKYQTQCSTASSSVGPKSGAKAHLVAGEHKGLEIDISGIERRADGNCCQLPSAMRLSLRGVTYSFLDYFFIATSRGIRASIMLGSGSARIGRKRQSGFWGDAMLLDLSGLDVFGLLLTALFGFLVGQLRRTQSVECKTAVRDMQRAKAIIQEFEGIASHLQQAVQQHQQQIVQFKDRVNAAAQGRRNTNWDDFSVEAERILKPTLALADHVARAYDQIKQQSNVLVNLQESRLDALTGVGNRRMFDDSLESFRALFNRYGKHFSLAMIDIDHFKKINDTRGHLQGDQALTMVGALLRELARETDIVARYGGEEFVILMPETPFDGAGIYCERVRREIESKLDLTVSIGTASTEHFGITDDLLHAADRALYQAKEAGRNLVFASNSEGCLVVQPPELTASPEPQHDAEETLA